MMPEQTLLSGPELICAFSSRDEGNMSLVYGDIQNSLKNRQNFLGHLAIDTFSGVQTPAKGRGRYTPLSVSPWDKPRSLERGRTRVDYRDLVCAKQIHGNNIRYVKTEDKGKGALSYDASIPDTDAFITDIKKLPLAVFTADCLSIFLYDPKRPAIGLVHAGWRSSRENIAGKTIKLMQEKFDTQPQDLSVSFGPGIRDCCYEVGDEFKDVFADGLIERKNHYYLDLFRINKSQLLDLGVNENNIFDSNVCTSCRNIEFFSYRKEGETCGRMMSLMMLK